MKEDVLALADDVESTIGGCYGCLLDKRGLCKAETDFDCIDEVCKFVAHRLRATVVRDAKDDTTVNAYDLLPEDERKAIAWVREQGGLEAVKDSVKTNEWALSLAIIAHDALFGEDSERDTTPTEFKRELDKRMVPPGMEWPTVDGTPVSFGERLVGYGGDSKGYEVVGVRPSCNWVLVKAAGGDILEWDASNCTRPILAADGEPLEVGQTVWDVESGTEYEVVSIHIDEENPVRVMRTDCSHLAKAAKPSKLTHERPVLDADGAPIKKGDTVYVAPFDDPLTVGGFAADGRVLMDYHSDDSFGYRPECLTHAKPERDSWGRLEEDATKNPFDYCKDVGHRLDTCENSEAYKARDLVRRAKKLAESGE